MSDIFIIILINYVIKLLCIINQRYYGLLAARSNFYWHTTIMLWIKIIKLLLDLILLGNPPKVTHEPIMRIISKQLHIKLGQFTLEELDSVLRKIKNRKVAGFDEIPSEVWKTRQFDILLRHCNAVYNQNTIDRWTKECTLPFPKKGDLR